MTIESTATPVAVPNRRCHGRFPAVTMVRDALGTSRGRVGVGLVILVVLIAVLGPWLAPQSATAMSPDAVNYAGPGAGHVLGTDGLARDVLSRTLEGGWKLLLAALAATALGVGLGTVCGVIAAYEGGWVAAVLLRSMDAVLAFPQLVFALLLLSIAGPSTMLIVVAVAVAHMPQVARVIYSAAMDVSERDFIRAVELIALPRRKILWSELLPNLSSALMVEVGLRLTFSIVLISGLSFLGLGFQPPDPDWGTMINENRIGMASNPWAVVAPVTLIALLTVGTNTITDALARATIGAPGLRRRKRRRITGQVLTAVRASKVPAS